MKRLSGLDASFLYLETPSTPMHTMGLLLLEARESPLSLATIESLLLDRMHHLPSLRQRVVETPLKLDHPVLVDDPEFDIRNHVVRVHWDDPGTLDDVDWAVGELASRPLDRSRPLWQVWWFDHLEGGGSALLFKLHHAIIDGVSSAVFMAQLLDTQPTYPPVGVQTLDHGIDELPGASTLAVLAMVNQATKSANALGSAFGMVRGIRDMLSVVPERSTASDRWGAFSRRLSPRTSFNGSLSTRRTISRASVPLEGFRYVKKAFDTTINDVVLAACTIALRSHLCATTGAPDRALIASIPVSTRQLDDEPGGNHVSALLVRLPVQVERAEDVIRSIRLDTLAVKCAHQELQNAFRFPLLETVLEWAPPAVLSWLAKQHESLGLADLHPPPCNLIVSNIAGPRIPLYCAGARVQAAYPFGPLMSGSGLNLTVMSYCDRINLGLIACPRRMPEAQRLVSAIASAVSTLCEAADRAGRR